MSKVPYLTLIILSISITSYAQTFDKKKKGYDATQYLDTLIVNNKQLILTKKDLKSNFREYTKNAKDSLIYNGDTLAVNKARQLVVKSNKDSLRAHKNVWTSILGGPSYTPASSFGVGGAVLLTFKFNPKDSILKRSTLPIGFLASLNETFMISGASEFYLKQNKIQINSIYGIRYQPTNYFGVGFKDIDNNSKSDSTTLYKSLNIQLRPIISFKVAENMLLGPLIDYSYYQIYDVNPLMAKDSNYIHSGDKFLVAGLGVNFRYDTRDNSTMPYEGVRFNFSSTAYGKWLGGSSNFTYTSIDYRQYQRLFNRRSVLAWTGRVDVSTGDVPFTELPSIGSPFDLRGYAVGHYRDKTMGYAMVEYRHMFGSTEVYNYRRPLYSRLGFAVWGAVGSIGENVWNWDQAKWNYGIGLRIEVQPNTNFRLDIGKTPGGKILFYMNMIEAF